MQFLLETVLEHSCLFQVLDLLSDAPFQLLSAHHLDQLHLLTAHRRLHLFVELQFPPLPLLVLPVLAVAHPLALHEFCVPLLQEGLSLLG